MTYFKNILIAAFLIILIQQSNSQVNISFSEYQKGEYLGCSSIYSLLKKEPQKDSKIIDTIHDYLHQGLSLKVIDEETVNGYLKVQTILSKWSNDKPDPETGVYIEPSVIDNGIIGWVSVNSITKNPVPDYNWISVYKNHQKLLSVIIDNIELKQSLNKSESKKDYKSRLAQCHYLLGKLYFDKNQFTNSIYYTSKAIDIMPKKSAFILRGLSKLELKDYRGVITDCDKIIELLNSPIKPTSANNLYLMDIDIHYNFVDQYALRGMSYYMLGKFQKAIEDLNIAISNNDENGNYFLYRGLAKYNLKDINGGCNDLSKAGELGITKAYDIIKEYCN